MEGLRSNLKRMQREKDSLVKQKRKLTTRVKNLRRRGMGNYKENCNQIAQQNKTTNQSQGREIQQKT